MDFDYSFFSPGKLLITGEYLVIDGAKALTLPTKKGQWLKAKHTNDDLILWKSYNHSNEVWFEGVFKTIDFTILSSSDIETAKRLQNILKRANALDNEKFLDNGWEVITQLDFPNDWGLGSSSTLLCNIAKWLNIDPYKLHFAVSSGSGYDIASGMEFTALIYEVHEKNPNIELVQFNPPFRDNIYFIHLNQKQKSDQEVAKYSELKKEIDLIPIIESISRMTKAILNAKTLTEFENLLTEHEQILSYILQQDTSQEQLFQMYKGGITKYLGAWGGDFVLVTAQVESDLTYFREKGYQTILSFDEMIKL